MEDKKSIVGYCVYYGETPVAWSSKKQKAVSHSSTELEYQALSSLAIEIVSLCSLLSKVDMKSQHVSLMWCDNLSVGPLVTNLVYHACSKHIEIDVHYVKEHIANNLVSVSYVTSTEQVVDCFTKPLTHTCFWELKSKLEVT